ncbi:hypothetical protein AGLY_014362 [Aphis glycines]|uniref:Uncharacterized protein n=1 Tax=Aphis glycines TaxID=307491 RepID=A0A6G0T523_APHGL|nr:hypothetical protein AGLY_014362 [Aphis glycines]
MHIIELLAVYNICRIRIYIVLINNNFAEYVLLSKQPLKYNDTHSYDKQQLIMRTHFLERKTSLASGFKRKKRINGIHFVNDLFVKSICLRVFDEKYFLVLNSRLCNFYLRPISVDKNNFLIIIQLYFIIHRFIEMFRMIIFCIINDNRMCYCIGINGIMCIIKSAQTLLNLLELNKFHVKLQHLNNMEHNICIDYLKNITLRHSLTIPKMLQNINRYQIPGIFSPITLVKAFIVKHTKRCSIIPVLSYRLLLTVFICYFNIVNHALTLLFYVQFKLKIMIVFTQITNYCYEYMSENVKRILAIRVVMLFVCRPPTSRSQGD